MLEDFTGRQGLEHREYLEDSRITLIDKAKIYDGRT
jgi:hypothetical protein